MVATKATELDAMTEGTGCLGKTAMDEPIFILRAQDQLSSTIVRRWAELLHAASHPDDTARRQKVAEAFEWARRADEWRATHGGGKVPD